MLQNIPWELLRFSIEEADNRFGLILVGRVYAVPDGYNIQLVCLPLNRQIVIGLSSQHIRLLEATHSSIGRMYQDTLAKHILSFAELRDSN